jgi:hypothetical protein
MKLGTRGKVLLGVVTLWPALWLIVGIAIALLGVLYAPEGELPMPFNMLGGLAYMVVMLTLPILVPALVVFYLVYVFRKPGLSGVERALWTVAVVAGSVIAMPVFFYLHILRDAAPPATIAATP